MITVGAAVMWAITLIYFIYLISTYDYVNLKNYKNIKLQLILCGVLLMIALNFIFPIIDFRFYSLLVGFILFGCLLYEIIRQKFEEVYGEICGLLIAIWLIIQGIPNFIYYSYFFAFTFLVLAFLVLGGIISLFGPKAQRENKQQIINNSFVPNNQNNNVNPYVNGDLNMVNYNSQSSNGDFKPQTRTVQQANDVNPFANNQKSQKQNMPNDVNPFANNQKPQIQNMPNDVNPFTNNQKPQIQNMPNDVNPFTNNQKSQIQNMPNDVNPFTNNQKPQIQNMPNDVNPFVENQPSSSEAQTNEANQEQPHINKENAEYINKMLEEIDK